MNMNDDTVLCTECGFKLGDVTQDKPVLLTCDGGTVALVVGSCPKCLDNRMFESFKASRQLRPDLRQVSKGLLVEAGWPRGPIVALTYNMPLAGASGWTYPGSPCWIIEQGNGYMYGLVAYDNSEPVGVYACLGAELDEVERELYELALQY